MFSKTIFYAVSIIICLTAIYFCVINWHNSAASQFAVNFKGDLFITHTFAVIIAAYISGKISGFLLFYARVQTYKEKLEFYIRKIEQMSQQNDIDTDDKEALQRKIASLEIALDNALKNKN